MVSLRINMKNYTLFENDRRYIGDTTILFGIMTTIAAEST